MVGFVHRMQRYICVIIQSRLVVENVFVARRVVAFVSPLARARYVHIIDVISLVMIMLPCM